MINKIKANEILWGFSVISILWALGIFFSEEIPLIADYYSFSTGLPEFFGDIFPIVFGATLIVIAVVGKRNGLKNFFKTAYILSGIPIISAVVLAVFTGLELYEAFVFIGLPFMISWIPVGAVMTGCNYSQEICLAIFVLSLVISIICYLKVKENFSERC